MRNAYTILVGTIKGQDNRKYLVDELGLPSGVSRSSF
jgi:hypothetical protein